MTNDLMTVATTNDALVAPAADPAIAGTMGFFLDDWQTKTFTAPAYLDAEIPSSATNTVTVDATSIITKIPKTAFAHNANTWMTPLVTEPVFMEHITHLHPNIIRFPGGSSSDVYFWNAKTNEIPADAPRKLTDKEGNLKEPGYGYGKTNDDWRASLDNYYDMLQQSGNRGLLTVNYGYARYGTSANPVATAAQLAAEWVRYDNGRTQYWEVGNENYADWEWGYRIDVTKNRDGQPEFLTGKLYAQHFKVFADAMHKAAREIGKKIYIGAVLYESAPQSGQVDTTKTWNSTMLPELNNRADFYVVHNYFTPYNGDSSADVILGSALSEPVKMIDFVTRTLQSNGATGKPVAMTEWNMWASGAKQQVSNTSGVFAFIVVAEALKNKYGLAARWDLLNAWDGGNDHGLFSAGDEPGVDKWTPRPAFHYLYYFQKMIGDRLVMTTDQGSANVKSYASSYSSGQANINLVNLAGTAQTVEIRIENFRMGSRFYWYSLAGSNDKGEFSRKVLVNGNGPTGLAGGPANYATLKANSALTTNGIKITVPPFGAVCLVVDNA